MVIFIVHEAILFNQSAPARAIGYITYHVLGTSLVCSRIVTRAYGTRTKTATDS